MRKRFTTRVRFIDGKTLPWHAYVTDNLTGCKFANNHETEQQAREWVKWVTQTCEKGRKTPENWN